MSTTDTGSATQPCADVKPGPIAYFAGNPVAANLLMLFFLLGGIISGAHLAIQHFPEIDLRTVSVTVPFPGASPREVEEDVNRRIEESIVGLPGVERVVSTAAEGLGRIDIELSTFADATSVRNDVQNAADGIENIPPLTADQPELELQNLDLEVMTLAVSFAVVGENELRLCGEPAQRPAGVADHFAGETEGQAGSRDLHRAERRRAEPPRPVLSPDLHRCAAGFAQPSLGELRVEAADSSCIPFPNGVSARSSRTSLSSRVSTAPP